MDVRGYTGLMWLCDHIFFLAIDHSMRCSLHCGPSRRHGLYVASAREGRCSIIMPPFNARSQELLRQ